MPKAHVEKVGNEKFNQEPMGSGPYKFVSIQRGVKTTLARNDAYWGTKGQFATARVPRGAGPGHARRQPSLRQVRPRSSRINADLAQELKKDAKVKVLSVLSERVAYFHLNSLTGPTANLKVRQAIAHAIDKQGIIDGLMHGFDKPAAIMLSPAHVGFVDGFKETYPYDPAKAKALLKEAGVTPDQSFTLFTAPTFDQRIVQAIQQMLIDVGMKVTITHARDFAGWLKRAQSSPAEFGEMTFSRWSCGCQDADGTLFPLYHSSQRLGEVEGRRDGQGAGSRALAARHQRAARALQEGVRDRQRDRAAGAALSGRDPLRRAQGAEVDSRRRTRASSSTGSSGKIEAALLDPEERGRQPECPAGWPRACQRPCLRVRTASRSDTTGSPASGDDAR